MFCKYHPGVELKKNTMLQKATMVKEVSFTKGWLLTLHENMSLS